MEDLDRIVRLLKEGQVISFPTETVYALACDATNDTAVKKIYELKNRKFSKPLAVFFKDIEEAKKYLLFGKKAEILAKRFMPGEITLVLQKRKEGGLSKFLNKSGNTLGFRIPNHEFCLKLLERFNKPIAATSANITGEPTAINKEDVRRYFGSSIYVWDKNAENSSKKASTIIDLSREEIQFVREGSITFSEIKKILKETEKWECFWKTKFKKQKI